MIIETIFIVIAVIAVIFSIRNADYSTAVWAFNAFLWCVISMIE